MIGSALTLFMTGILANNAHHTLPADHAAGFAEFLDRSTDFHGRNLGKRDTDNLHQGKPPQQLNSQSPETVIPAGPEQVRAEKDVRFSTASLLGKG